MDWGNPSLRDEAKTRKEEKEEEKEKKKEERCGVVMCRSRRGGGGAGWRQSLAGAGPLLLRGAPQPWWMGGPQISAPLSHGHVTGRGQWHRQYLNQLHCSSAIRGEASRRGSYWRQGRPCGGRAGCQQARRGERGLRMFENGKKGREGEEKESEGGESAPHNRN